MRCCEALMLSVETSPGVFGVGGILGKAKFDYI